ncbi:MAG: tRNA preQ1(34) S-adenosylmethionine ribosyltransferase-isomerase QueA [Deltaproteobacteria bacterium]|nr:tRNA preQ1(34) S-adenosylmethionine ribosyltransferase-isomerase QueA [Deltaproteobacteria bacterium]
MSKNSALLTEDFLLSSYAYTLPEALIAQYPSSVRGASGLYVLRRACPDARGDVISNFDHLMDYLPDKCLLVANNSRVVPARLFGRGSSGGRFEFLLLTPASLLEAGASGLTSGRRTAMAQGLLRPAKKFKPGVRYELDGGGAFYISAKGEFGLVEAKLEWPGRLLEYLEQYGRLPLPPYIKRAPVPQDLLRYQSVFNSPGKAGSVAAPTAGLHFTEQMRGRLSEAGHTLAELTLFVGYGTFSPVRVTDIREHVMHPEYVELPGQTVQCILQAKKEKRPVIAIGTTTTRVLEGLAEKFSEQVNGAEAPLLKPWSGWLNCFIYPGKPLRVIDGLLTNFHLPESTLLMLVSTLCGRKRLLDAYALAVEKRMRFFSYGDAMLVL